MQAVIFDMDGVIIDSEPLHYAIDSEMIAELGIQESKDYLDKFVGMTQPDMWRIIIQEKSLTQSGEELLPRQTAMKVDGLKASNLQAIDGIPHLIQALHDRGIPMAIASGSPRGFILAVVEKLGLAQYFQAIVSGEEVPHGKPAPDVFLEAARQIGHAPKDCLVIEDSRSGTLAARAAGMRCIGFINPESGNQDLSAAGATVERIDQVLGLLEGLLV